MEEMTFFSVIYDAGPHDSAFKERFDQISSSIAGIKPVGVGYSLRVTALFVYRQNFSG